MTTINADTDYKLASHPRGDQIFPRFWTTMDLLPLYLHTRGYLSLVYA